MLNRLQWYAPGQIHSSPIGKKSPLKRFFHCLRKEKKVFRERGVLCPGQGNAPGVSSPAPQPSLALHARPAEEGQSATCLAPAKSARRTLRGLYRHLDLLSCGEAGSRGVPTALAGLGAGNSF